MASRIIVRIELTPPAKNALNALTEKQGMTQVALLSRLVQWLAGQTDTVKAAVLGQYPSEVSVETGKIILQRMAVKKR
jgi:hypothetical protein